MNETASDKKPTPPKDNNLTRIPVRWLRFVENFDIPAQPQVSNLKGYAFPEGNPKWWSIQFIPAWQQFEITLMSGDKSVESVDPEYVPASRIYKWWRA